MKYFYVTFTGTILKDLPVGSDIPQEAIQLMGGKSGKVPYTIHGDDVIYSESGLFIPTNIQIITKMKNNLDECKINFVREMSEEEFKLEQEARKQALLPPKISHNVQSEIDYLISATEKGDLRVNVDKDSEKQSDDEFGGLFDKPDNWKD